MYLGLRVLDISSFKGEPLIFIALFFSSKATSEEIKNSNLYNLEQIP